MLGAETKPSGVPASATTLRSEADSFWREVVAPVKPLLKSVAEQLGEQVQAFDPEISAYARYALASQGKQLRPALVLFSGAATGRVEEDHLKVAVIIEMIHLATLVHDDIMDEAEIRRRRPTVAANWGNEISVLLGDCLFAHALKLAASFPGPHICRAVAAATNTVCSGEILQTLQRSNPLFSRVDYFKALRMKTGELFAVSCDLGAFLNKASDLNRRALSDYGRIFGTAYQIYDDCVDLFGSEASVGKSLGTDLAKGKLTLPVLVMLEQARPADRVRLQELLRNWEPGYLPWVLDLLDKHEALNAARLVIHGLIADARQLLSGRVGLEGCGPLLRLADFLAQQTDCLGVNS